MWDKSKEQSNKEAIIGAQEAHTKSSPFDGKIEFLSFRNRCYFGLCERGCTGGGMRISQGKFSILISLGHGPYLVTFNTYEIESLKKSGVKKPNKLYFQVDGEYLVAFAPKFMKLGKANKLPNGKVWTLYRNVEK